MEALGKLGGVYSALRLGGLIFTATFSYRLMMSSLIGKLFYFRPRYRQEVKKKKVEGGNGKGKKEGMVIFRKNNKKKNK